MAEIPDHLDSLLVSGVRNGRKRRKVIVAAVDQMPSNAIARGGNPLAAQHGIVLTRALFVRAIGEYRSERRDALYDPRTGAPLAVGGTATIPEAGGFFRHEWLISYEPTPGTVAYLGYVGAHESLSATSFRGFAREADGLFLKLAYRFRRQ